MSWIRIRLTKEEAEEAKRIGLKRYTESRSLGLEQSPSMKQGGEIKQLQHEYYGAMAEIAVAKYLGYPVAECVYYAKGKRTDECDVGPVEVRSTTKTQGRLIFRPGRDTKHDTPFIFVLTHRAPIMILRGWMTPREGRIKGIWWDPNGDGYAWWVNQDRLHPMEELQQYLTDHPELTEHLEKIKVD